MQQEPSYLKSVNVPTREFKLSNACTNIPDLVSNTKLLRIYRKQSSNREVCVWKPSSIDDGKLLYFIEFMKDKSFREDQALVMLYLNDCDFKSALIDAEKYCPKLGLFQFNQEDTAKVIIRTMINIRKHYYPRRRCFDTIKKKFPGHPIGDVLHFYMANKLKIKRKTAAYKKQFDKLSKLPTPPEFLEIVHRAKLNSKLTPIPIQSFDFQSEKNNTFVEYKGN